MFFAVNAGYNPETNLPWVELKEFNSQEEAEDYSESLDQPMYTFPIELEDEYYASLGRLMKDYSYPPHAIKDMHDVY